MSKAFLFALSTLFFANVGAAQVAADTDPPMEEVLVTGEQPGPGLWKVANGDHVLWILGEIAPQPSKVKWRSKRFEILLEDSQEVLLDFSGVIWPNKTRDNAEAKVRKLPKGQSLQNVVPLQLYARAQKMRTLYKTPERIDELRPFYAGRRILMSALRQFQMEKRFSATFTVFKLARDANIKVTDLDTPGQSHEEQLQNIEQGSTVPCLEMMVEIVEDGGAGLRRLANAWSIGDIDALRKLVPKYALQPTHYENKCTNALYGGEDKANAFVAKRTDIWLKEADRALRDNVSTMAVVSMAELFAPDGYLAGLRARGYRIVEPD